MVKLRIIRLRRLQETEIDVQPQTSVLELKTQIKTILGDARPESDMLLIFQGQFLDNKATIGDFTFVDKDVVALAWRNPNLFEPDLSDENTRDGKSPHTEQDLSTVDVKLLDEKILANVPWSTLTSRYGGKRTFFTAARESGISMAEGKSGTLSLQYDVEIFKMVLHFLERGMLDDSVAGGRKMSISTLLQLRDAADFLQLPLLQLLLDTLVFFTKELTDGDFRVLVSLERPKVPLALFTPGYSARPEDKLMTVSSNSDCIEGYGNQDYNGRLWKIISQAPSADLVPLAQKTSPTSAQTGFNKPGSYNIISTTPSPNFSNALLFNLTASNLRCSNGFLMRDSFVMKGRFASCQFQKAPDLYSYYASIDKACDTTFQVKPQSNDFSGSVFVHSSFDSCDFNDASFDGTNFAYSVFFASTLNGCRAKNARFDYCRFEGQSNHMKYQKFSDCKFEFCSFKNSVWKDATFPSYLYYAKMHFESCDFSGAQLARIDLSGCAFTNCLFLGADLSGAKLPAQITLAGAFIRNAVLWSGAVQTQQLHLIGAKALVGLKLNGSNFEGLDLSSFDFSNSTLNQCKFSGCNLTGAKFCQSTLSDCIFSDVVLQNVDFSEATFDATSFRGASFVDCIFLRLAGIKSCDFGGSKGGVEVAVSHLTKKSLDGSTLSEINFDGLDLSQFSFKACRISHCSLRGANLFKADFSSATLSDCDFQNVPNLANSSFSSAKISRCDFSRGRSHANVDFSKAEITECNFNEIDNFSNASFSSSVVSDCGFNKVSQFFGVQFAGAKITNTSFSGVRNLSAAVFDSSKISKCDLSNIVTFSGARFHFAEITESKFSDGQNLSAMRFHSATITQCDFTNVHNLFQSDFSSSKISDCSFKGVQNICQSSFRSAQVKNANFQRLLFRSVDFVSSSFSSCDFSEARFETVTFGESNWKDISFRDAHLHGANLLGCVMNRVDFSNALLSRAMIQPNPQKGNVFKGADLSFSQQRVADATYARQDNWEIVHSTLSNAINSRILGNDANDGIED